MRILLILALLVPFILCQSDDYNHELDGGQIGAAGIKARINQPGFDYFTTMIPPLLESQLRQAQIPPISQCLPQVGGCIQVHNLHITNFQCPQNIRLHPAPPNQLVISVQNVGVSVSGQLNGQVTVLSPMRLFGTVVANANQITITVSLAISRNQDGSPSIQVTNCRGKVRALDIMIQNGGTLGDLANTQFRQQISRKVKKMIPGQLCAKIPEIVNSKINEQASLIPQTIAVTRLLDVAGGALGLDTESLKGGSSGSDSGSSSSGSSDSGSSSSSSSSGTESESSASSSGSSDSGSSSSSDASVSGSSSSQDSGSRPPPDAPTEGSRSQYSDTRRRIAGSTSLTSQQIRVGPLSNFQQIAHRRVARQSDSESEGSGSGSSSSGGSGSEDVKSKANDAIKMLTKYLDMSKLEDLELSVRIVDTQATNTDYTVGLEGEFSQNGNGGTPFGPFPMDFPSQQGSKMAEALISDYTLNSLFYALHKKEFLSVKLGSDTPVIGPLLKTTCSDDEGGLEDNGVEVRRRRIIHPIIIIHEAPSSLWKLKRRRARRQDDGGDDAGGSLADLGICLGDILPIAREKYPNKNVVIEVSTERAPSLILSSKDDGTATINLVANAHLKTDSGDDIGTIHLEAEFEVTVKVEGNKLTGHGEITKLNLTDPTESLGLTQDALDSLGNLGKDMIAKQANQFLEKGIPIELPSGAGGLPIEFQDPSFKILDHAIHLEADFKISQSFVSQLGGGSSSGGTCQARRRFRKIRKL